MGEPGQRPWDEQVFTSPSLSSPDNESVEGRLQAPQPTQQGFRPSFSQTSCLELSALGATRFLHADAPLTPVFPLWISLRINLLGKL